MTPPGEMLPIKTDILLGNRMKSAPKNVTGSDSRHQFIGTTAMAQQQTSNRPALNNFIFHWLFASTVKKNNLDGASTLQPTRKQIFLAAKLELNSSFPWRHQGPGVQALTSFFRSSVDIDLGLSSGRPRARLQTSCDVTPGKISKANEKLPQYEKNQEILASGLFADTH